MRGPAIDTPRQAPRFTGPDLVRMMQCLVDEAACRRAETIAAAACKADTTDATWAALQSARAASATVRDDLREWLDQLHDAA